MSHFHFRKVRFSNCPRLYLHPDCDIILYTQGTDTLRRISIEDAERAGFIEVSRERVGFGEDYFTLTIRINSSRLRVCIMPKLKPKINQGGKSNE